MDCREFEDRLQELLEGALPAAERLQADRHRRSCGRCRELARLVSAELPPGPSGADAELTAAILRRTGGTACRAARDRLSDRADGRLPRADAALLEEHLDHCPPCHMLAETWDWVSAELPAMAEVDPGPWFAERVLQATSRRRPVFWSERARDLWAALLRRPRLAWEAPYVGAMVLLLLFGSPLSPLRGVPAQALAVVSSNPVRAVQQSAIPAIGPKIVAYGEAAWDVTGGKLWQSTQPMRGVYRERLGRLWEHGRGIGEETAELWRSLFLGDMDASADRLARIGELLKEMWRELTTPVAPPEAGETESH